MSLDNFSSCYLIALMTLNIPVLRKNRLIFKIGHNFIVFLPTGGSVSVKRGHNQFPVVFKLMPVTVFMFN